ncbi:MAG TPA: HAD-IA family hydrolase [Terracidiphilus sp.]|jgi:putative hydrolase of the HAD superfamily|nr:HAD-IA family hydrolase [Terracidiphilus sp.]
MFPFDVILFDVGGVLLTNGWDHRERAVVLDQFHLDHAEFEARHTAPNDAWERDAISAKEYLDATVFYQPRSFTHDAFLDAIRAQSQLLPDGAMGILRALAASDKCMLGVLNNEARATNEYRFDKFGIRGQLKVAFSSCYLGLRKPGQAIYKRALDILGVPAQRILFIDDRAENASGAEAVGMKAIRFTGADALRSDLTSLGVL